MRVDLLAFAKEVSDKGDKGDMTVIVETIVETIGSFLKEIDIRPFIDPVTIGGFRGLDWAIYYDDVLVGFVDIERTVLDQRTTVTCQGYKIIDNQPKTIIVSGR